MRSLALAASVARRTAWLLGVVAAAGPVARAAPPPSPFQHPASRAAADAPSTAAADESQYLFGDWGGLRKQLSDEGLEFDILDRWDVLSDVSGGRSTGTSVRGDFDVIATFDTGKLGLWRGGTFFLFAEDNHGGRITDIHVGGVQNISSLEADGFTQLSEYWYQHASADGTTRVRVGRQDANRDFANSAFAQDFLHSSFGILPNVEIPSFPNPQLGASAFVDAAPWFRLKGGVFQGSDARSTFGTDGLFSSSSVTTSVAAVSLQHALGSESDLEGHSKAGVWYRSGDFDRVTSDGPKERLSGNYGLYSVFDQRLSRESDDEAPVAKRNDQGLRAFLQCGWAPPDRNEIRLYLGGGVTYIGLVPGRSEDASGFGVANARFSPGVADSIGTSHETAFELFYKAQLSHWLFVEPDLQYVLHPGGNENAVVVGFRFSVRF